MPGMPEARYIGILNEVKNKSGMPKERRTGIPGCKKALSGVPEVRKTGILSGGKALSGMPKNSFYIRDVTVLGAFRSYPLSLTFSPSSSTSKTSFLKPKKK